MKKVVVVITLLIMYISTITPVSAFDEGETDIFASYAYVEDFEQGIPIYGKQADKKMYPASMTKVVTTIVALEMISDLDATTIITEQDLDTIFETGASAAHFFVGEKVTYRDLVYGAMLPSGADATRALAFNLCGGQETFVEKMNSLVKELGLTNTNFVNTTGIHDDNHYTTAREMATIVKYALKNPIFYEIFSSYMYNTSNSEHVFHNTGMYYGQLAGHDISRIIGCKSGFTEEASNCLASLVEIDGREVIVVVGHSDGEGSSLAVQDTNQLIEYVSDKWQEVTIHSQGEILKEAEIQYGNIDTYQFKIKEDIRLYLPKNYTNEDTLKYVYTMDELEAPIREGDTLGTLEIRYEGTSVYKTSFVSEQDISKDTFTYIKDKVVSFLFPYGLCIILTILYIQVCRYKPKHS